MSNKSTPFMPLILFVPFVLCLSVIFMAVIGSALGSHGIVMNPPEWSLYGYAWGCTAGILCRGLKE